MIKILDIGCGVNSVAAQVFTELKDKEIVRLDADESNKPDVLHDITTELPAELHGQFDIVYASHVLEHIDRNKIIPTLVNISRALKNLGEMWVIVPSLEWGAQEVLKGSQSPALQGLIFGGQNNSWDYHRTGFTLASLRTLFEIVGLVIRKAYQSPFKIGMDAEEYVCIQNIVIGARYDGLLQVEETPVKHEVHV